jgi:hypothetical protein
VPAGCTLRDTPAFALPTVTATDVRRIPAAPHTHAGQPRTRRGSAYGSAPCLYHNNKPGKGRS